MASPVVYLAGRSGMKLSVSHALLAGPHPGDAGGAGCLGLLSSVPSGFLAGHTQTFGVQTVWLRVDGISLLVAGYCSGAW